MIYKTYKYSRITGESAIATAPWIDNESDLWYAQYGGYHSGIDITAETVYSYASGVVLQVGADEQFKAITIQYSSNIILRYLHMDNVLVKPGQVVYSGQEIGTAHKYVHFEYASRVQGTSMWPVRIGAITYYKQNPELVIDGIISCNK